MSTRRLVAVTALAALALSACTSGPAEDPGASSATAPTSSPAADGLDGTASQNGWFCRYVGPKDVLAANKGKEPATPREHQVSDDTSSWVCEVLTGGKGAQQPLVRLTVLAADDKAIDELRARVTATPGVEPGPEHLGDSFVAPGLIAGFMPCTDPEATNRADKAPYAIAAESLGAKDEATAKALRLIAGRVAINLDQTVGCSPQKAREAAATTAP